MLQRALPEPPIQTLFVAALMLAFAGSSSTPALAPPEAERFWLAGRYDGNRIVVYFDAVHFRGTVPSTAVKIADAVADGFFTPVILPQAYVFRFQQEPGAEHFAVGDRYDLLPGGSDIATITLTTLVGFEGDEETGNASFIGALATIDHPTENRLNEDRYYAVRRHIALSRVQAGPHAALIEAAVRPDIQTQTVSLLNDAAGNHAHGMPPTFKMQQFTVPDGSLRYYARAEWGSGKLYALGAWLSPRPVLQILALEKQTATYGFDDDLPVLRNVVDLGNGKSGIIVSINGEDGRQLSLLEYRDGLDLRQMRMLQSLGAAE
jgi:hypothetical protein